MALNRCSDIWGILIPGLPQIGDRSIYRGEARGGGRVVHAKLTLGKTNFWGLFGSLRIGYCMRDCVRFLFRLSLEAGLYNGSACRLLHCHHLCAVIKA